MIQEIYNIESLACVLAADNLNQRRDTLLAQSGYHMAYRFGRIFLSVLFIMWLKMN